MDAPAFAMGPSLRVLPTRTVRLATVVGVVVRDDGSVVLVDTGWSEEACADPVRVYGRAKLAFFGLKTRPEDAVVAQLRSLGIAPSRVTQIVATHLHFDHIGAACDFPNAEVVCTDRELVAFRASNGPSYRAEDLAKTGRVRSVSLESEPLLGFPASHDLFGDGEITLLDARGHTRGTMAVAMRGAKRPYVHIGDAAYQAWEYGTAPSGPSFASRLLGWSLAETKKTYDSIRACARDPSAPVIVPSHDMGVFETLPHAPA